MINMKFLIETPHTPQECLRALDEQLEKGEAVLEKFNYGCQAGDHTGYAIAEVRNEQEARGLVPGFLLDKTRIIPVDVFTPEVIKSFHTKAA